MDDRETSYSILYECYEEGAFSNLALGKSGISDFVRASVYGTLTYTYSEDYIIKLVSGKDIESFDPVVLTILRFGTWQILFSDKVPDYAAVDTSVRLAKVHKPKASGLVNAILHKVVMLPSEKRDMSSYKSPDAAFSLKPEIYGVIKKSYGKERAPLIAKALLSPAPLSIRVNTLKTDTPSLRKALESEGFGTEPASFMKDALILRLSSFSPSINNSKAYADGLFMVQGEGAQLASVIADPKPGMKILDCCSAPGGKTTHIAQMSCDKAKITALDINSSRIKLVEENARRLGISGISTQVADSSSYEDDKAFDIVLVDAPCSGLGIMGGKPDIRLTITYDRIEQIIQRQKLILDNIARSVKPGGKLVYSTCTINRSENEDQVFDFLSRNNDFELYDFDNLLPESLKSRGGEGMITLLPDEDRCEGFFISGLRRKYD